MTNVEILRESGQLGAVRQRLGAQNEKDASCDEEIDELSALKIVEAYAGWFLGDGGWAREFISLYEKLKERKFEK